MKARPLRLLASLPVIEQSKLRRFRLSCCVLCGLPWSEEPVRPARRSTDGETAPAAAESGR
eukprot:12487524-Alexandrium_andersonii.AAC.1